MVAVPLGNAADITQRALRVLAGVDRVICEDTRKTGRLLSEHGLRQKLQSFRAAQMESDARRVLEFLRAGERLAFTSDAGTPAISDPGSFLVREVRREFPQTPILPVPGANSLGAALSVAGFQTNPTLYLGFPSPKASRRRSLFREHAGFEGVVVVLESVHRVENCLSELRECFPDREILIAREMTKTYEQYVLWLPDTAFPEDLVLKGEFTLVVGPKR